jgi:HEAT repeat protein
MRIKGAVFCFGLLCWLPRAAGQDLETLLSRFESEHQIDAQKQALQNVAQYRDTAGPGLFKIASRTEDKQTKWLAIAALGELQFQEAAQFIVSCLRDEDPKVRQASALALSRIDAEAPSAIPVLIELLKDEQDGEVVRWAADALTTQILKAAVPVVKDAMPVLKSRANDGPTQTRMAVISSIGVLGGRDEVPYLATFLDDRDGFVALTAARMIEGYTGQDFAWCGKDPCGIGQRVQKVKAWWRAHSSSWK